MGHIQTVASISLLTDNPFLLSAVSVELRVADSLASHWVMVFGHLGLPVILVQVTWRPWGSVCVHGAALEALEKTQRTGVYYHE